MNYLQDSPTFRPHPRNLDLELRRIAFPLGHMWSFFRQAQQLSDWPEFLGPPPSLWPLRFDHKIIQLLSTEVRCARTENLTSDRVRKWKMRSEILRKKSMPLISIIAPMYNLESYIEETINSVLSQTYSNFELILIDDCSNDKTLSRVEAFSDPRIRLIINKVNEGAGNARNKGLEVAQGQFIALLDADDTWYPHKLQAQIDFMTNHDVPICYTLYDIMDKDGRVYANCEHMPPRATYHKILRRNFIRTSSLMYDVSKVGQGVGFRSIRKRQDMLFFLGLIKKSGSATLLRSITCSYRMHPGGISAKKRSLIPYQWAAYRYEEKLSIGYSSFLMLAWFILAGSSTFRRRLKERWRREDR